MAKLRLVSRIGRFLQAPNPKAQAVRYDLKAPDYVALVAKSAGWTREEARRAMDAAKSNGISYRYYAKKRLWARTEKQMAQAQKNAALARSRSQREIEHALHEITQATGWKPEVARKRVLEARRICGCSYKDYYRFRLYEKTPAEQKTYLTVGVFEQLSFRYNPDPEALRILLRKDQFAKEFSDLFYRPWFVNRNLTFEEFRTTCGGLTQLILKPLASTQGKGVSRITFSDYPDLRAVYEDLMHRKRMLCEACIVQHPAVAAFNPSSVNTVRVLTIVQDGRCHLIYAGFRTGRGSLVDNFHAGGIIASVDVKTGITCMDSIDLDGKHYPVHPISGLETKGFQLPNWPQVQELVETAALRMAGVQTDATDPAAGAASDGSTRHADTARPIAGMVGWDVAITPTGACLVEGNSEPSHTIIQLPYVDAQIGMRHLVDPFL